MVVKVGKTEAGASMAQSHTGHLTGSDAVTSAVFRQFGVTRVDGLDELLDISAAFARTSRPKRARLEEAGVCVYAISGGTGAHMADMASAAGLRIPELTKKTQKALHDGLIPSYLRVSNPVDCGGPPVMTPAGRKILAKAAPGTALSEYASKQVLRAYGINTTNDVLCRTPAEAVKAAKAIGFPVVMKVSSPDLLHKSDAGLVRVGVVAPKEVRAVHEELLAKAKRADRKARIEGVIVSEMVSGGVETLVGISNDALFGPVVTVGLGGIFVEVLHDVTFRVPPFHRDEAQHMVDELQGAAMLRGVRGAKPVDVNPLVVRSRGVVALDALVVRK